MRYIKEKTYLVNTWRVLKGTCDSTAGNILQNCLDCSKQFLFSRVKNFVIKSSCVYVVEQIISVQTGGYNE